MNIRVIINGQVVDLPPTGLNLPMTYSLKSRDGININTGSRSEYAFELPATQRNSEILNQFYDPAIITINQQIFLPAIIEVDGQTFFNGKCQLQSATIRGDIYSWQGKTYKVAFYGNNSDWVIQIGDLLIKDLGYTLHTYSYTDNINNWYSNYPAFDFKYLPIKFKDWDVFGQVDALTDSHPALFVADIINKAFNLIGYTQNSSFITSDFFQRLIMPVPLLNRYLQGEYSEDYLNVKLSEPTTNVENYILGPPYMVTPFLFTNVVNPALATPYNPATGFYTVPTDGYYFVRINVNVISTGTHQTFLVAALNNDVTNFIPGSDIIFGGIFAAYTGSISMTKESQVAFLTAGTTISLGICNAEAPPGQNVTTWEFGLEIFGEAELSDGISLDLKYVIDPSLKVIDLIKGVAHAFNLVFETDETGRKVQIEPADDFLLESRLATTNIEDGFYTAQKTTDLTPYIDLSKEGELVSDTKMESQLRLKWKDDSNDPTVEALNLNENLGILEARFNFPTQRYKAGETILENPFFAPTLVVADNEVIEATSLKTPMIPFIWSVNYFEQALSAERPTQILPRLLVSDITLSFPDYPNGTMNVFDGLGVVGYACPLNYMIDYNDTWGFQTSLSFGDVTVNGFNIQGLLKRFYLSELVRKSGGKYLELFIFWGIVDIQNLSFRNKIVLNNNLYILQEINAFDVAKNQSTKTYFVYDNKELGAENSIQSTDLTAKINLI